jgi:hypothetical protein
MSYQVEEEGWNAGIVRRGLPIRTYMPRVIRLPAGT